MLDAALSLATEAAGHHVDYVLIDWTTAKLQAPRILRD